MSFRVGQKVVCVDAAPRYYRTCHLIKGEIYTIERCPIEKRGPAVILVEVKSPNNIDGRYFADRFRPIDYTFGEKVAEKITKQVEKELVPLSSPVE
jgi:hypothetical protein